MTTSTLQTFIILCVGALLLACCSATNGCSMLHDGQGIFPGTTAR